MKKLSFLCIVCCFILSAGLSSDASEQKQGTWKLVQIGGILTDSSWFANRFELITIYGNLSDYYVNGETIFSGSVDSLISRYYTKCELSVTGDTLRFTRSHEQKDLPFSWMWVRYSDSSVNFNGTWRWIETVGGFTGVSRTRSDYFNVLKVNGTDVVNTINDSIAFSGKRDSLLHTFYGDRYTWVMTADTLFAFQKPQCCDIPYIFKWIRWLSGQTGASVLKQSMVVSVNEKPECFDIRGRMVASGFKSASGIHLLYNKNSRKINVGIYTSKSTGK